MASMGVKDTNEFIRLETLAGIVLIVSAVLALVFDNSPWSHYYRDFFDAKLSIHLGFVKLQKPLLLWINEGLMTIFFFLVGLEIKREIFQGQLKSMSQALLPIIAALGGIIFPALIFIVFNSHDPIAMKGWAIPVATDIAFSLGILALLGSRVPSSLKVFLTALAIIDDLAAVIIIAVFYTDSVSILFLLLALLLCLVLLVFNRMKVASIIPYLLVGFFVWLCVLKSGVHATLAGVILAFAIPLDVAREGQKKTCSPAKMLEKKLHPWVAFAVIPIFAFANAGVSFVGLSVTHFVTPLTLGIGLGLFLGKQLGIWLSCMIAIKLGVSNMPKNVNPLSLYGVSLIAGIGFTMSLFIGSLSFGSNIEQLTPMVRVGVLAGSLLSGILGYTVLRVTLKSKE